MMKTRRFIVITSLVMVSLLITTGVVVALGVGAVNQGTDSTAEGDFSTVSGGRNNNIPETGDFATIGGGENNTAENTHDTIGGGGGNTARGSSIDFEFGFATIGGGQDNRATGPHTTVGGGQENLARGSDGNGPATVGGGRGNEARGAASTIGGGCCNIASGLVATIAGGQANFASGVDSAIGGGDLNTADGHNSTIAGGEGNIASGVFGSAIGGGFQNRASGNSSTVPGGHRNIARGDTSFAAGKRATANHNGTFVWADGQGVPFGGPEFASTGENQFLIRASGGVGIGTNRPNQLLAVGDSFVSPLPGNRVTIGNTGTPGPEGRSGLNLGEGLNQRAFILWHNDENYLQLGVRNGNVQENDALVVKDRRVGVGTANPTQRLHVNGNVRANRFLTSSSERWKTNIQPIEGALEKVENLRGVSYDWKADGKHDIGLIAEEVGKVIPEVVVYEENGKDATAVDYAKLVPVLIEGMKEQQQMLEDKDAQIAVLKQEKDAEIVAQQEQIRTQQQEIAALQARMTTLEESLGAEAREVQTGLLPFSASIVWMLVGGVGLVLATPGLVLGYRRIRRDE
jgi:hypothetical protein